MYFYMCKLCFLTGTMRSVNKTLIVDIGNSVSPVTKKISVYFQMLASLFFNLQFSSSKMSYNIIIT